MVAEKRDHRKLGRLLGGGGLHGGGRLGQSHKAWVGIQSDVCHYSLEIGGFWEQQEEAEGSVPSLRFHARVGLAELELQTRALEKALHWGEVRLVGSWARPGGGLEGTGA